ncbi:MAG: amino acid adenylation domain-containing protein [Nevskiaceae bacterium]|nr:amino acid adenylation domain-containing protein [Nevskiaceae bacterium]
MEVDDRLRTWNSTHAPLAAHCRIEDWVSRQAARTPDAVAVQVRGVSLTYAQLQSRANRLANVLRSQGCGPHTLVGVCLTRGPDMIPTLLGILATGAAYVPLDPGFPADRLSYMAEDANVKVVVTESACAERSGVERSRQLRLDDDAALIAAASDQPPPPPANATDPTATAYVIYTSGSTGKPKGVVLPQRAVCNFLASMRKTPGFAPADRLLAVTTLSFDIAVLELFLPLISGGQVILAQREEAMDPEAIAQLIAEHHITVLQATPTTWQMLLENDWQAPRGLKALCGGEALPQALAQKLLAQGIELWNMYGPTETTVWSTLARITSAANKISIGRPIDNTQVWVLDESGNACAPGQEGELCIGGDGVATGYFNRPELTAERFIADPFSSTPGARIYRTGDLGRWLETGELEHLGRLDFQVKIRGYRIELGEIENRLIELPGITRAVVMAREDIPGDVALVGYVVAEQGAHIDIARVREGLKGALPDYMLPRQVVVLDALPQLPNGKIDRKALPAPSGAAQAAVAATPAAIASPVAPTSAAPQDLLHRVAEAMASVLSLPQVLPSQNFFELGGYSVLAARLASTLGKTLNQRISIRQVFESPTPESLATAIAKRADESVHHAPLVIPHRADQSTAPLSRVQQWVWYAENRTPGTTAYHMSLGSKLTGPLDVSALDHAFQQLIARQSALRTVIEYSTDGGHQRILPHLDYGLLPVEDLSSLNTADQQGHLNQRIETLAETRYDLEDGPLFTARLFKLSAQEHVLFFQAHHLIWDAWSFDIFCTELAELYSAIVEKREPQLAPISVSYGDFAAWHNQWMSAAELERQRQYWVNKLSPLPPPITLPCDHPHPAEMSGREGHYAFTLPHHVAQTLREQAQSKGRTLYITLLAAYALALRQWSGQTDFVIGTPVRGREQPALENLLGFFVNMLPLPMHVEPGMPLEQWLGALHALVIEAFASPDAPFDQISRSLKLPPAANRPLLYQVTLSYENVSERPSRWGNVYYRRIPTPVSGDLQDLSLACVETAEHLEFTFVYNRDVLESSSVQTFARHFQNILAQLADDPSRTLASYTCCATNRCAPLADDPSRTLTSYTVQPATDHTPDTPTQRAIAEVWKMLLHVEDIKTSDNFFELGGHSILAMRAIGEIEKRLGARPNVRTLLFDNLGQIAQALDTEPATPVAPAVAEPPATASSLISRIFGRLSRKR